MVDLSEYERRALEEVRDYRRRELERSPRRVVPEKVRAEASRRASIVGTHVRDRPAGERAARMAGGAYKRAMDGLGKATSRMAKTTLSERRVRRAFVRRGHAVAALSDIRSVDLEVVDRTRPRRIDVVYGMAAALEGALAGGMISGGEALATLGSVESAGVAAAPGIGTVAAAMGGDAVFVLAAGSRAVAHTAMYYGYDPNDPAEKLYVMAVLNLGTASTASMKYAAYRELSQLAQQLARRATWAALRQHAVTRVAERFAAQMGVRLTQKKLGQLVPIAGIVVGAGLNYGLLDSICDAAHWAYRERFLLEKQGEGSAFTLPEPPELAAGEGAEAAVSVLDLLKEEGSIETREDDDGPRELPEPVTEPDQSTQADPPDDS